MKPTINVSLRFTVAEARIIKRAARLDKKKLATFVREAAGHLARIRLADEPFMPEKP